jgi:hypothetical protein
VYRLAARRKYQHAQIAGNETERLESRLGVGPPHILSYARVAPVKAIHQLKRYASFFLIASAFDGVVGQVHAD